MPEEIWERIVKYAIAGDQLTRQSASMVSTSWRNIVGRVRPNAVHVGCRYVCDSESDDYEECVDSDNVFHIPRLRRIGDRFVCTAADFFADLGFYQGASHRLRSFLRKLYAWEQVVVSFEDIGQGWLRLLQVRFAQGEAAASEADSEIFPRCLWH